MSLLDALRESLASAPPPLAVPGTLRLHTLFSVPRPVKSLYPLAHIHPHSLDASRSSSPVSAYLEHIVVTASWTPHDDDDGDSGSGSSGSTLVFALETFLYTLPEHRSAVLYISKLDTTGYGPDTLPAGLRSRLADKVLGPGKQYGNTLTAQLSSAFIKHFAAFKHWSTAPSDGVESVAASVQHLSVHILARSQRAYLFPGSPENGRKKVLSDGGLIRWWRDVMSDVVVTIRSAGKDKDDQSKLDARAFYLVPGYTRLESHELVPLPPSATASVAAPFATGAGPTKQQILAEAHWTYGYPYSEEGAGCSADELPPLPLHWRRSSFIRKTQPEHALVVEEVSSDPHEASYDQKQTRCIATLMPHFLDDPKTRFMDELQRDAHEHAGWRKTERPDNASGNSAADADAPEGASKRSHAANGDIDKDDVASANKRAKLSDEVQTNSNESADVPQAGHTPGGASAIVNTTPLPILRGQVRERASLDDLSIDEFWLRMGFRQECSSGNAVGVLVCLFTRSLSPADDEQRSSSPPKPTKLSLPHPILQDLVFKRLMRDACEWNKEQEARELTKAWNREVGRMIKRKGGWLQSQPESQSQQSQHWQSQSQSQGNAEGGTEDDGAVGKHIIWDDVPLPGPSQDTRNAAEAEMKKEQEAGAGAAGQGAATAVIATTNVLSVKRKKKPIV